jgi:hypothetical protein
MEPSVLGKATVTFAVLVGSLCFVLGRQCRACEAHVERDELRRQVAVAQAEQIEMEREIQVLLSRTRVVPDARRRLGMHMPDASEQVFLPAEPGS